MPFKFPGISQAYERKKEREGLVDPQGGAHLPSAAVQAFWPELQRATARLGSGETKSLMDFVADLMPDDPTYGMPMPGAGMVRWRKGLDPITHYKTRIGPFENMLLDNQTLQHARSDFRNYKWWNPYSLEQVPLADIEKMDVWNPDRIKNIRKGLSEGVALPPVRLAVPDTPGPLVISDGIHRIAASREKGYDHVPALVSRVNESEPTLELLEELLKRNKEMEQLFNRIGTGMYF